MKGCFLAENMLGLRTRPSCQAHLNTFATHDAVLSVAVF